MPSVTVSVCKHGGSYLEPSKPQKGHQLRRLAGAAVRLRTMPCSLSRSASVAANLPRSSAASTSAIRRAWRSASKAPAPSSGVGAGWADCKFKLGNRWACSLGVHWASAHCSTACGETFQWFRLSRNAVSSRASMARMTVRRLVLVACATCVGDMGAEVGNWVGARTGHQSLRPVAGKSGSRPSKNG